MTLTAKRSSINLSLAAISGVLGFLKWLVKAVGCVVLAELSVQVRKARITLCWKEEG